MGALRVLVCRGYFFLASWSSFFQFSEMNYVNFYLFIFAVVGFAITGLPHKPSLMMYVTLMLSRLSGQFGVVLVMTRG